MRVVAQNSGVWPGFRKVVKSNEDQKLAGMSNDKWLRGGEPPDFVVTPEVVAHHAAVTASMWIKHPAYKMTLASVQQGVDANNDGLIDTEEFKALLEAAGYKGGGAAALFAQIDADGDGTLTEAEIKLLSQDQATLTSGKQR